MNHKILVLATCLGIAASSLATAQSGGGTIEGIVHDAQGLTVPGVTVTLSGAAVLGEQTAVTLEDGSYRFRALRPGTYDLRFEIAGFQSLHREGILVEGNRTFSINVVLNLATVSETVTVRGESPVVDVKTTALSNEFDTATLHDVPSATDVWAVLGQTVTTVLRSSW